jgi:membrane-bound serine protease (ClpP class)
MLFDRAEPGFRLSLAWIIPATLVTAAFFILIVAAGLRAQFLPVRAGKETMLGKPVSVLERVSEKGGRVFVEGEYWNALSETAIEPGEPAEIVSIEGLTLRIRAKQPQN